MLEVRRVEGRLVVVKVVSPLTLEEIAQGDLQMKQSTAEAGGKVVISADYRATRLLNPAEAEALITMFRSHNDSIERSAILVSEESAMAVLQMSRVIKQANLPTRRAFKDPKELIVWLGEVLTPAEGLCLQDSLATE